MCVSKDLEAGIWKNLRFGLAIVSRVRYDVQQLFCDMSYFIVILSLQWRFLHMVEVPTLEACVLMTTEANDDGRQIAACIIRSKK